MPVLPNPFGGAGEWLRCALHAHTTRSDGDLPPELVVRHYEDSAGRRAWTNPLWMSASASFR